MSQVKSHSFLHELNSEYKATRICLERIPETGEKFDWRRITELKPDKPFMIGGGIGPEDADQLRSLEVEGRMPNFAGVDINSRFEIAPGNKDMEKIRTFIGRLK